MKECEGMKIWMKVSQAHQGWLTALLDDCLQHHHWSSQAVVMLGGYRYCHTLQFVRMRPRIADCSDGCEQHFMALQCFPQALLTPHTFFAC